MIIQKKWFSFLILCWWMLAQDALAQVKNIGKPFIINYSPSDYHAHDQNWCLAQDQRGVLYVGNSTSLLEFDGVNWRSIEVPNKSTVRSLVLGKDGVLYVGAQSFLGYVATDAQGKTYIASLMDQMPKEADGFRDIWEMYQTPNEGIVCRGRRKLLIIKNKKITVIKPQNQWFFFSAMANGEFFVNQPDLGNFVLKNGKLALKPALGKSNYRHSIPFGKGKTLLFGSRTIKVYDGQSLQQFSVELDKYFKKFRIYCATKINENYFAVGLSNGGILVVDNSGKVIQLINKKAGLLDNDVYSLYVDQNQNLWAGLSKGIAHIEINSPFSVFDGSMGLDGATYYTYIGQNRFFVATSTGIYYKNWKAYENPLTDSVRFQTFPNSNNQTWQLKDFKGEILATYNPGIYRIQEKNKILSNPRIVGIQGNAWSIIPVLENPNYLLVGTTNGLQILEWKDNQWKYKQTVKGYSSSTRYLQQEAPGVFWRSYDQKGVYKIKMNEVLDSVLEVKFYDKSKGLPSNTYNRLFKINNKNVIATEDGVYEYNTTADRFIRESQYNKLIGNHRSILYMRSDAQQNIWYVAQKSFKGVKDKYLEVGLLKKQSDGSFVRVLNPFRKLRGSLIEKVATNLNPVDAQNIIFGTKEGAIHYSLSTPSPKTKFSVLLREITLTGAKDSVIFGGNFTNTKGQSVLTPSSAYRYPTLPYTYNGLRFNVGSTYYADAQKNQFRYWLKGFDKGWTTWTNETYKEYTNLPEGNYTLFIQTRNLYQEESQVLQYRFKILPPWYRTTLAYTAYVVISLLLLVISIRLYTYRLYKQKEKLEQTVKERTTEIIQKNEEILTKNSELEQQKEEILIQAENLKVANVSIEQKSTDIAQKNAALEQQKEEIQSQAEVLRSINTKLTEKSSEIEKAYNNIKLLSEIGKEITSKLSISQIVASVYSNINNLMDVAEFGIGLYNAQKQTITYKDYIHLNETMPQVEFSTAQENRIATVCVLYQREILINDMQREYHLFIESLEDYEASQLLNSAICIPLIIENNTLGLISVQSLKKNAYTDYHLNLLRNLAVYITIALQNTDSLVQITSQKRKIENQNEEIKASIRYAQKIQNSILPSTKSFEQVFDEHFVIYEPKDIVSGDFYWMSHVKKRIIIDGVPSFKIYTLLAAVDCTGHGVPGAFMSLIGSRLLSEIVNEKKIFDPKKILEKLQSGVRQSLHQRESENNDGMDVSLCRIEYIEDSSDVEVLYANAKRPLYYTHQNKLYKIKRDKVFIGGWIPKHIEQELRNHTIMLTRGDVLYLSSDGYVDNPNIKRKSFGTKKLVSALEQIMHLPLDQQKSHLVEIKNSYQEGADQRDDILFLGVKL
ncbi:hypothetical protein BKI52_26675 [marine bacterium AO1-C]|nr:hypothetical protein BKI52_26675 [marine bacterium AO1-C]